MAGKRARTTQCDRTHCHHESHYHAFRPQTLASLGPSGWQSWRPGQRILYLASGPRRLRTGLHPEKARRESRQRQPHCRGPGPGAQPSLPEDENFGDCCQGVKSFRLGWRGTPAGLAGGSRARAPAPHKKGLTFDHMDFGAVLEELHFIHELIDEENAAAVLTINVLPLYRTGDHRGVKSLAGIPDHD